MRFFLSNRIYKLIINLVDLYQRGFILHNYKIYMVKMTWSSAWLCFIYWANTARVYMFLNSYWHGLKESYLCSLQNKNHGWTHFCICCRLCCSCIKDSCPTEKCICCFERQSRGTVKIVMLFCRFNPRIFLEPPASCELSTCSPTCDRLYCLWQGKSLHTGLL